MRDADHWGLLWDKDKRMFSLKTLHFAGGLTKTELENPLDLITPTNFEDIEYEQFEKGKQEGFNEGYSLGLEDGKVQIAKIIDKEKLNKY